MTIHAVKNFHGFLCGHAFKKAAYSLQVTVASAQILDIVQIAILEVEINLLGTYHCARHGSYMTDSIFLTVRHDSVIFSYVFHIYNFHIQKLSNPFLPFEFLDYFLYLFIA